MGWINLQNLMCFLSKEIDECCIYTNVTTCSSVPDVSSAGLFTAFNKNSSGKFFNIIFHS
jgi:hypothetical protein